MILEFAIKNAPITRVSIKSISIMHDSGEESIFSGDSIISINAPIDYPFAIITTPNRIYEIQDISGEMNIGEDRCYIHKKGKTFIRIRQILSTEVFKEAEDYKQMLLEGSA